MGEAERLRMKRLAWEGLERRRQRARTAAPVSLIADQGMAERGEMHPDLMRAPGREAAFDERRCFPKSAQHAVMSDRLFAAARYHRHLLAVGAAASDPRLDPPRFGARHTAHDGEIGARQAMRGEIG